MLEEVKKKHSLEAVYVQKDGWLDTLNYSSNANILKAE